MPELPAPVSPSSAHILLVDDEPAVRLFIAEELRLSGYQVTTLASGEEALIWLRQHHADVMVIDFKMDGMDGLQVMATVQDLPLPPVVIMLTAHGSLDAAVAAMRRGGYDFLRKPCSPEELLNAIQRGLVRRRKEQKHEEMLRLIEDTAHRLRALAEPEPQAPDNALQPRFLEGRSLLLDRERETLTRAGERVDVSPTEFRLLACLMARPDEAVSFRDMFCQVYGVSEPEAVARDTLRTTLWRLGKKLGQPSDGRPYIVNVRGRGYMFVKHGP